MDKIFVVMMYLLWVLTLAAILIATFTSFQYSDLNFIAIILALLTIINTLLFLKTKK
jgi:hypothetical protein